MCSYTNGCCELHVFTLQNWLWIIYLFPTALECSIQNNLSWESSEEMSTNLRNVFVFYRLPASGFVAFCSRSSDFWRMKNVSNSLGCILVFRTLKKTTDISLFFFSGSVCDLFHWLTLRALFVCNMCTKWSVPLLPHMEGKVFNICLECLISR